MQRRASAQVDRAPGLPRWRGARRVLQSPSHALAPRKSLNVVALSVLLLLLLPAYGRAPSEGPRGLARSSPLAPEAETCPGRRRHVWAGHSAGGDEEEKRPCTLTRDRECQCKAGTFLERDSPEFCRKCSTSCPDGMVQNRPCTPWSDLKCVSKGSRTKGTKDTISAKELVATSMRHPNAEVPEMRRMLLVPVNGTDPTETLKRHFDYFITVVPFLSWKAVMRKVGLTDNDICMAAAHTVCPDEEIYVMLVRWLQKTGKGASVNTLLDALEAVGERNAKEMIQNHLVGSGEYTYKENLLCEHV
ncbi:tumor necrosis factor receptor superfamily member 10B-like [Rhynchocyon petersi]